MLIIKNKIISNKNSFIANKIIKFFIKIVAENKLPFIDLTTNCGRTIIYNNVGDELKKLFFSQTPKAWLDKNLLTTCQVNKFNNLKEKIFRIEFPIFKKYKNSNNLFLKALANNLNTKKIASFLHLNDKSLNKYYHFKKKVHFNAA